MGYRVRSAPQGCEDFSFHKGIKKQGNPEGGEQGAALLYWLVVFFS